MIREIKFRAWTGHEMDHFDLYRNFCDYADPSWPVMQYTGLKDRNGREVYEGDIIDFTECDPLPDGSWLRTVVRWNDKDCQFDYGPVSFWIGHVSNDGEVIGNIHEHPELLKR
jgi:hypothetical protein